MSVTFHSGSSGRKHWYTSQFTKWSSFSIFSTEAVGKASSQLESPDKQWLIVYKEWSYSCQPSDEDTMMKIWILPVYRIDVPWPYKMSEMWNLLCLSWSLIPSVASQSHLKCKLAYFELEWTKVQKLKFLSILIKIQKDSVLSHENNQDNEPH